MSIFSFKDKKLENLYYHGSYKGVKGVPDDVKDKIISLLDLLDAATTTRDLNVPGFHPLKGDRRGVYALKITANWRLTFRFLDGKAFDVDREDYHR